MVMQYNTALENQLLSHILWKFEQFSNAILGQIALGRELTISFFNVSSKIISSTLVFWSSITI